MVPLSYVVFVRTEPEIFALFRCDLTSSLFAKAILHKIKYFVQIRWASNAEYEHLN